MAITELLAMAASFSLLAGWRLYAAVLVAGIAMKLGWIALPDHLSMLGVLAHPAILVIAAIGAVAELLADKIAWVDSGWDAVHSLARPLGGAALALAIIDPADPMAQVAVLLLGGGGAFLSHGAKAGTRAAINLSPEPVSNILVSSLEDALAAAGLALALLHPAWALALAAAMLLAAAALILAVRRALRRLARVGGRPSQPPAA